VKALLRGTSHTLALVALVLVAGVGSSSAATGPRISTVVGTGVAGSDGDGGPAAAATFDEPRSVIVERDGSLLVADAFRQVIRRIAPDGTITRIAGNGTFDFSGDGGPATRATFRQPHSLSLAADGSILVADALNNRIRRIAPDGTVTTVAGALNPGFSGDGVPATSASIDDPHGVAALPDGGFLIADTLNNRIRKVDAHGTITTVAGTGASGFSGDGGPATAAMISSPFGVSVMSDGGFLIDDVGNQRIRRVTPSGIITTVAGNGTAGFSGDGGPATAAKLNNPHNVLARPDGSFYIADASNNRIRLVSANGTISTVVGNGRAGYSGDGGAPSNAGLNAPKSIAVTPTGALVIADSANHRVRFVGSSSQPYFSPLHVRLVAPTVVRRGRPFKVRVTLSTWATITVICTHGRQRVEASPPARIRPGTTTLTIPGNHAHGTFIMHVTAVSEFGQKIQQARNLREQ
jgi:hypothetical protein